jgi:hypothetical protein
VLLWSVPAEILFGRDYEYIFLEMELKNLKTPFRRPRGYGRGKIS